MIEKQFPLISYIYYPIQNAKAQELFFFSIHSEVFLRRNTPTLLLWDEVANALLGHQGLQITLELIFYFLMSREWRLYSQMSPK